MPTPYIGVSVRMEANTATAIALASIEDERLRYVRRDLSTEDLAVAGRYISGWLEDVGASRHRPVVTCTWSAGQGLIHWLNRAMPTVARFVDPELAVTNSTLCVALHEEGVGTWNQWRLRAYRYAAAQLRHHGLASDDAGGIHRASSHIYAWYYLRSQIQAGVLVDTI